MLRTPSCHAVSNPHPPTHFGNQLLPLRVALVLALLLRLHPLQLLQLCAGLIPFL